MKTTTKHFGMAIISLTTLTATLCAAPPAVLLPLERTAYFVGATVLAVLADETIHYDSPFDLARGVPADQYLALPEKYPPATAIVSLAGAPAFPAGDFSRLPAQRPQLLCPSGNPESLLPLFEHGVIQTAIIPRLIPAPTTGKPKTNRERFDQQYMILTAANAASVLAPIFQHR